MAINSVFATKYYENVHHFQQNVHVWGLFTFGTCLNIIVFESIVYITIVIPIKMYSLHWNLSNKLGFVITCHVYQFLAIFMFFVYSFKCDSIPNHVSSIHWNSFILRTNLFETCLYRYIWYIYDIFTCNLLIKVTRMNSTDPCKSSRSFVYPSTFYPSILLWRILVQNVCFETRICHLYIQ